MKTTNNENQSDDKHHGKEANQTGGDKSSSKAKKSSASSKKAKGPNRVVVPSDDSVFLLEIQTEIKKEIKVVVSFETMVFEWGLNREGVRAQAKKLIATMKRSA